MLTDLGGGERYGGDQLCWRTLPYLLGNPLVRNHTLVHVRSWWMHVQNQRHTFHNIFSIKVLCDCALSRELGCFNVTEQ